MQSSIHHRAAEYLLSVVLILKVWCQLRSRRNAPQQDPSTQLGLGLGGSHWGFCNSTYRAEEPRLAQELRKQLEVFRVRRYLARGMAFSVYLPPSNRIRCWLLFIRSFDNEKADLLQPSLSNRSASKYQKITLVDTL